MALTDGSRRGTNSAGCVRRTYQDSYPSLPWLSERKRQLLLHARLKAGVQRRDLAYCMGITWHPLHYYEQRIGSWTPRVVMVRAVLWRFMQICCSRLGAEAAGRLIQTNAAMPRTESIAATLGWLFTTQPEPVDYSWARYWEIARSRLRTDSKLSYHYIDRATLADLRRACSDPADVARVFHLPDPGLPPWNPGAPDDRNDPGPDAGRQASLFDVPALGPPRP